MINVLYLRVRNKSTVNEAGQHSRLNTVRILNTYKAVGLLATVQQMITNRDQEEMDRNEKKSWHHLPSGEEIKESTDDLLCSRLPTF